MQDNRRGAIRLLVLVGVLAAGAGRAWPEASPVAPAGSTPSAPQGAPTGSPPNLSDIGMAEFLEWAHPAGGGCAPIEAIEVAGRWPGGMRVRFDLPCAGARRRLEAVVETREGRGVWQVAAGFEGEAQELDAAIRQGILRLPRPGAAAGAPGTPGVAPGSAAGGPETAAELEVVSPPPANPGEDASADPLRAVAAPVPRQRTRPVFPEEAGRARLIGGAHVELLVDVSRDGVPLRARPLRGPDPDLGMRQAALQAVAAWSFSPAVLAGRPVRYFTPVEVSFDGLPPESRLWSHRALFDLDALVYDSLEAADAAGRRLRAGATMEEAAPDLALDGHWGLVSAADLPAPLRKTLHETMIGLWAGPVEAGGHHYLARKRGEVYYAILPTPEDAERQYRIVHLRGVPDGDDLRRAIDADILKFTADRLRRDYMNEAARLMGIRQARAEVGQLDIHTDALSEDEMRLLGQVVGAAFRAHQDFWAGLTTLRLFREQVMVYAFGSRTDHQRVQQVWRSRRVADPAASLGEYIPASRILAFPCEQTAGHLPIPIAVHESIHMLDHERVYGPRARPSRWFEEGLANYFGFSQITSQLRIEPGDIRRSGTIVLGTAIAQFDPRAELREHLRLTREEGPVRLGDLIAAGPRDPLWAGGRSARAYGAAWTLVHFLIHGDRGSHAAAFRQYAGREARGEGGPQAFRELFGPDLDALETAWHAYEETL